jgi:hypothetical protein
MRSGRDAWLQLQPRSTNEEREIVAIQMRSRGAAATRCCGYNRAVWHDERCGVRLEAARR